MFDVAITLGRCCVASDASDAEEISGDADERLIGLSLSEAITCS